MTTTTIDQTVGLTENQTLHSPDGVISSRCRAPHSPDGVISSRCRAPHSPDDGVSISISSSTPSEGLLKFLDDSSSTPARKHLRVMVKRAAEKNKYLDISSIEPSGYGCRTMRRSDLQEKEAPILILPGPIFSTLVSSNHRAVRVLIDILQEENCIHPTSRTMMQIVINGMKRRFSTLPAFDREPGRCYCGSLLKRIPVESLVLRLTESETCISICSRSNQKIHQCRYT